MINLRAIRRDILGLTQTQLADALNVSQAAISRWESGKDSPAYEKLQRIRSYAIGTGVHWNDAWFFDGIVPSPGPSRAGCEDGAGPASSSAGPAAEVSS